MWCPNPGGDQDQDLHRCVVIILYLHFSNSSLPADPLSSYKRKDDLMALAGALNLKTAGTVIELTALIKSHLSNNPSIELNPRFAGLFLQKRHRMDNSA